MSAGYGDSYDPDGDFDRHYTLATARRIKERISAGARILELGCGTGLMSSLLADGTVELLGVDHSATYLERARERGLPGAEFRVGDLDVLDRALGTGFDHVIATNVLHELSDPVAFLRAAATFLAADGLLHLSLQNPRSIHRLCALELGMIASLTEISARGEQWGTRSLWTSEELEALAVEASFRVLAREGVMLKPLPNALMAGLPEAVIEGFIRVSDHFPDNCAMTYLVLSRG